MIRRTTILNQKHVNKLRSRSQNQREDKSPNGSGRNKYKLTNEYDSCSILIFRSMITNCFTLDSLVGENCLQLFEYWYMWGGGCPHVNWKKLMKLGVQRPNNVHEWVSLLTCFHSNMIPKRIRCDCVSCFVTAVFCTNLRLCSIVSIYSLLLLCYVPQLWHGWGSNLGRGEDLMDAWNGGGVFLCSPVSVSGLEY